MIKNTAGKNKKCWQREKYGDVVKIFGGSTEILEIIEIIFIITPPCTLLIL